MASKKRRSNAIEVDFNGVESGGSRSIPDGTYLVEVKKITQEEGSDSGEPYLAWQFKVVEGKYKGATLFDNTSLQPQALWKLKTLLECLGEEVPDSTMRLVLSDYIGRRVQVEVTNEEYNGKDRPRITGYLFEGGESEEDEEEEDEEEDEEDEEEDEEDEEDEEEDEEDEEEDEEDEEEDEEDEEEDEEEEPKPARGKGKRALARAAARKAASKKDDDEEEDDEDEKPSSKRSAKSKKSSTPAFKKGDRVSFDDDGTTIKGKIVEIDGSVATVDVKGDEWQVQVEDLTPVL